MKTYQYLYFFSCYHLRFMHLINSWYNFRKVYHSNLSQRELLISKVLIVDFIIILYIFYSISIKKILKKELEIERERD